MVKNIFGHYYVYEYSNYTDSNGRCRTKMGKAIGAIKEGLGFVPNSTFASDSEISSLDFGEYAVSIANSEKTLDLLWECFNPEDAARIYALALIHFIQGFTYLKDVKDYYDMNVLSLVYPALRMGCSSLSALYDSLGRRQGNVLRMEKNLLP